jgi:hypothetical protein
MNEDTQFAQKISHALNQTTDGISPAMAARLHAARTHALSYQRQPVAMLSLAGIGHFTSDLLHGKLRTMVLAFALTIGVVGTYYVNDYMQADENEEVDSALLADDLPINAYLDAGFQLWVDDSSPASH